MISLFIVSVLSENIILSKFLGICPFLGVSDKQKKAVGMGIAVTFVMVSSSILIYLINKFLLIPSNSEYLQTLTFILVIAAFVQISEIVMKKYFIKLYDNLGIYLPLITTNCAILGVILLATKSNYNFLEFITYAVGSSLGFTLVIYIFTLVREKMENSNIIKSFDGIPISLIVAGIMAMIFSRLV